ncbi:MAG TPA: hypothetical protein VFE58_00500 [Tepidisphaeraceae bacterium]|nr:hypothetical protein [Tepidisphaeraceae bacterium]
MKSLRRWTRLTVIAAAVALIAQQAGAQVINQIPDTALVVVRVASLQKTSGKIASLAQKIGIAQMVPQLQDPMAALTQKMHDPKGINKDGEAAFVYLNPDVAGGDKRKSMLILIPVSDYTAFLTNLHESKTEGDITSGKFTDDNDTTYAAHWGDYAVISPTREVVATKPTAMLKVQGVAAKELAEKDLAVYANFAQIRAIAIPALQKNRELIMSKIEEAVNTMQQRQAAAPADPNAPAANPQATLAIKDMINQGLNLAQQFLQDTESVTWGLNLSDDGVKSSLVAEFAANSYLGQLASTAKNTDRPLLSDLPANNYLFLTGASIDSERIGKIIDDIGTPIIKNLKTAGVDTAGLEKYVGGLKQFYSATQTVQMGVVAPSGALGQEALFQSVGVLTGNADQIVPAMHDMSESQAGLGQLLGQPKDQTKVTLTPNAKTIEGVSFDRVQTQFNFGNNTPQGAQAQQMLNILYGPDGLNLYSGKVDDKHVVVAAGANDAMIAKTVQSAKANADAVGKLEQLKMVNAQLPASRLAVFYFPIDNLVTTGVAYAKQFGLPIQIQLPPTLPPIGASHSTEASAYRLDGFVPAPLVQSLVAAGMQAFMAMQGGAGGAQPAGPGGL